MLASAPSPAMAINPATRATALLTPEARPASSSGAASMTAAESGETSVASRKAEEQEDREGRQPEIHPVDRGCEREKGHADHTCPEGQRQTRPDPVRQPPGRSRKNGDEKRQWQQVALTCHSVTDQAVISVMGRKKSTALKARKSTSV